MSGIVVELGNPLPLNLLFEDGEESKYARAYVYDESMAQVAGSPFNLTLIENAWFRSNAYTPTVKGIYHAIYIVYDDAAYTIESEKYLRSQDVFTLGIEAIVDADAVANAVWESLVEDHQTGGTFGQLMRYLSMSDLVGIIEEDDVLLGVIENEGTSDELVGLVVDENDDQMIGVLSEDN